MQKPTLIVAAVVVLALVGAPPVVGGLTQSQVAERVAMLDANPMAMARVVDYDRGWFSSTATIELGVDSDYVAQVSAIDGDVPPPELMGQRLPIVVDIAHGPIAVGDGVHLGWSSFVARLDPADTQTAELLERLAIPYLFEFRGRTSYTGTIDFDADMPAIETSDPEASIAFSGATLDGSLAGRDLRWDLAASSLRVANGDGRFVAQGIGSSGDVEIRSQHLAIGTARLGVDGIQATGPFGQPLLEMANLEMQGGWDVDPSGELLTGTVSYAAGSVTADQVELADAALGIRISNLDAAAMEAYYEALQRVVAAGPADPAAALGEELSPVIEQLLARSPILSFEPIRFRWQNEPFDANVLLELDGAALPPLALLDPTNPLPLIGALRATANARLSKALAEDIAVQVISTQLAMMGGANGMPPEQIEYMAGAQAGLMLVTLVGQGYLVDGGDSYSTDLRFANGTLTINGNELPLPIP